MSLIASPRLRRGDLEHWRRCEEMDRIYVERCRDELDALESDAIETIRGFARTPDWYVSVSWGKDSVVVAHLASRAVEKPMLRWFPAGRFENPDNVLVRDAFLARVDCRYDETAVDAVEHDGVRHDGAQRAFERASLSLGLRYVSGVRAEESGTRRMAMRVHGESSSRSCRPIGWWSGADVFAYLYRHDLPIHPAYACTLGGAIDRGRIRVSTLGGDLGTSHGRAEWERCYYGRELAEIERVNRQR